MNYLQKIINYKGNSLSKVILSAIVVKSGVHMWGEKCNSSVEYGKEIQLHLQEHNTVN